MVLGGGRVQTAGVLWYASMKIFTKIAVAAIVLSASLSVAAAVPKGTDAGKYAAIVIDANSGKTLYQYNANARRYPASLTKMMTLYLLFEAMQSGRISANTPVRVSAYAAARPPTKIGFKPGQSITAENAARALIIKSANDVASAVAEYLGGSEKGFAQMMTQKARSLGMMNTHFTNASGLPDVQNYSTARDMAILSLALREHFPGHYHLFNTTSFSMRGQVIRGHNRLVSSMKGVDGLKTGYVRMSGFNVATSMRLEGKSLVGVVMGGQSAAVRDAHMAELLKRHLGRGSRKKASVPLVASWKPSAPVLAAGKGRVVLPVAQVPVPVAKADILPPAISDREHDAALLTALTAIPANKLPAAVLAVDEVILPVTKAVVVPAPKMAVVPVPQAKTAPTGEKQISVIDVIETNAVTKAEPADATAGTETGLEVIPAPLDAATPTEAGTDALATASVPVVESKGWVVQIAAAASKKEAEAVLARVETAASGNLGKAQSYTQIFDKGDMRYYRVRFSGFASQGAAKKTCQELVKASFKCFVVKD
ncbi:MAG: D-alanyl-D-alanine carboxypeptidase [Candidatus Tokpelaia hoelldobleri]|uniref:D-alanyl-D-alanine carboxypeptidase n=1 Tax=Candidatus Tokpelaia hoelldobleri TaxID=1902579 RepID=A0A1U9JUC2_9HYPH|nr:MAG: D-alanyl-D-alanine carboxypeptidase [Candidatus Tokpelaia hoelldoblerii]